MEKTITSMLAIGLFLFVNFLTQSWLFSLLLIGCAFAATEIIMLDRELTYEIAEEILDNILKVVGICILVLLFLDIVGVFG